MRRRQGDKTLTKQSARLAGGRRKQTRFAEDVSDLLSWWGSTLSGMLPSGLVNAYSTRRRSIYLWAKDGSFAAALPGKAELGVLADSKQLRRRVAASDPVLLFNSDDVLVRHRRMPVTSITRLNHAMRLQITAETPFDLNEIYASARIVGEPDSDGCVLVEQAIVKRDLADACLAELHALEIDPAGADIVDEEGRPAGFNLLPPEKCARQGAFLPTVNRVLTFAALALTVALGASWYLDLSRQAAHLDIAATENGKIAREVLAIQASAQTGIAAIEEIQKANSNPGRFAIAYAAVTDALGDDAWLEGFTYTGNTATLVGLTRKSDGLISSLESSPTINSARFIASVITDRRHDAERFRVEVVFKSGLDGESIAAVGDRG